MTGSRWRRGAQALLGLGAGAAIAVAMATAGCGSYPLDHQTGGSKGPEIRATAASQQPRSAGASQMSQSNPPPPNLGANMTGGGAAGAGGVAVSATTGCAEGTLCSGASGCVGVCEPSTMTVTSCASCDNTMFTDCTQRPCTP